MLSATPITADAWARLKCFLVDLRVGDCVTVHDTATVTQLAPEKVDAVLQALVRAGLFEQHADAFVRCHLHWN
jgi:hypothetical protein